MSAIEVPKMKKWDAVRFVWSDPQGVVGEWTKITDDDMRIAGCVTVGQVFKVWRDRLTVVCSWDSHNKHANGGITVPYCLMSSLEVLV